MNMEIPGNKMTQPFSYVWLLPLLEQPYQAVVSSQERYLAGLVNRIEAPVPEPIALRELLLTALESDSAYWAQCATRWLEDGFPLDPALRDTLLRLASQKKLAQSVRHRLVILARRWQRLEPQG